MSDRKQFEAWCKDRFECSDYSFAKDHDGRYYNSVRSMTYGGRLPPNYADVQMPWEAWVGSREAEITERSER